MSDTTGGLTAVTRRWIDDNVPLFVVIVIVAALLVIALVTLAIYCCCCRRKKASYRRGRGESKGNDNLAFRVGNPRGDRVDAGPAKTATTRSPGLVEIQIETSQQIEVSHQQQQQQQLQFSSQRELVKNQPEESVSTQEVHVYIQPKDQPYDLELQQMSPVTPEVVRIEMAPRTEMKPMRLPRTEVSMVTEVQSPKRAVEVAASRRTTELQRRYRGPGISVYQSDENEITIVDSDFSDYEDSAGDAAARKGARTAAGWAGENTASWETLPNSAVQLVASSRTLQVEEPPVLALNAEGREYTPAPAASLEETRLRRAKNLAELDVTLSVFEQQVEVEGGGRPQVETEVECVDEELVMAVDRSQVLR